MSTQTGSIDLSAGKAITTMVAAGFENAEGKYATKSEVEQTASSITSTVAATYTTKQEFDNLEIGGRNLLKYSRDYAKGYGGSVNGDGDIDGTYKECSVWRYTKSQTSSYEEALTTTATTVAAWTVGPDEDYVLSFWAKASTSLQIYSYFYISGNNTCTKAETSTGYSSTTATDGGAMTTIGTGWERYWVRWHFGPNTDPTKRKNLIIARMQANVTGTVWIAGPKLEKGTRNTDWSPAPEDVETRMTSAETVIEQTANNVLIKATKDDTTAAQGGQHLIESLINVATSGVTISANKVNIEGAAIFTGSGRLSQTSLNSAYDAKGTAATAVSNNGNLFLGTAMNDRTTFTNNSNTDFSKPFRYYNGSTSIHSFEEYNSGKYQDTVTLSSGNIGIAFARLASEIDLDSSSTYLISCWAKCSVEGAGLDIGLSYYNTSNAWIWRGGTNHHLFQAVDTWQYFELTFKPDADTKAICYCFTVNQSSGTFTIRDCRLVKAIERDAIAVSQRIYYRTNANTSAPTAPTSLVTRTDVVNLAWTRKRVPYDQTYKYLYTCEQRKSVDGTILCTPVLLDDTTTVIDGGNIITGTVTANQIAAEAITAGKIDANAISVGGVANLEQTLDDNLNAALSAVDALSESTDAEIAEVVTTIEALSEDFEERTEGVRKDGTTHKFGQGDDGMRIEVGDDAVTFMSDADTLATVSESGFAANTVIANEQHFTNETAGSDWMWIARENGNLTLKWVGGDD